jgi:hypothetical protein
MTNMPFHPGRRWAGHGLASLVCATVLLSACGGGGGGAPSAAPANTVAAPTDPTSGSGAGGGSGTLALFAGSETTAGTQDGAANVAGFNNPQGLAVDAAGNVYVADTDNFAIRKITPEGVVSTVAGQIGVKGHADGGKSDATFNGPTGIALDASGNIYVSDMGGFNAIRKVTPQGDVLTLVNTEMDKAVQFNGSALVPFGGVAVNASGSKVYFSAIIPLVSPTNMGIFTLSPDGAVTLLAGGGAGSADGQGAAAGFANVPGLALDEAAGYLYVSDWFLNTVRKISLGGLVSTVAGVAGETCHAYSTPACTNPDGVGDEARFYWPQGMAPDGHGNVYVVDAFGGTVRKIAATREVSTVVGKWSDGSEATVFTPGALPGSLRSEHTQSPSTSIWARGVAVYGSTLYTISRHAIVKVTGLP